MTQIPTTTEVNRLGSRLASDGFGPLETQLSELVQLALTVDPGSPVLLQLDDRSTPSNVRFRSFDHMAADWERVRSELIRRGEEFDRSLSAFLAAWNAHEELRSSGGSVSELFASRSSLNSIREQTTLTRKALPVSC